MSGKNQDQELLLAELTGSKMLKRFNLSLPKPKAKVSANLTSKYPAMYNVKNRSAPINKSFYNC